MWHQRPADDRDEPPSVFTQAWQRVWRRGSRLASLLFQVETTDGRWGQTETAASASCPASDVPLEINGIEASRRNSALRYLPDLSPEASEHSRPPPLTHDQKSLQRNFSNHQTFLTSPPALLLCLRFSKLKSAKPHRDLLVITATSVQAWARSVWRKKSVVVFELILAPIC